jgi:hypothetical protein
MTSQEPPKPFCIKEYLTKHCMRVFLVIGFLIICVFLPMIAFKM